MGNSLIEKLGNTGKVAAALGVNDSTVSMWKKRGIPWRYRPAVASLALQCGVVVPADFFEPRDASTDRAA